MTNFTDFLANVVELFVVDKSAPRRGKKSPARTRRLTLESLENRELLAVTGAEWTQLQSLYADLNLGAQSAYNVIEVGGIDPINTTNSFAFSVGNSTTGLTGAIAAAGMTTGKDLIVVRTTAANNKITLTGAELGINIAVASKGSVTIVSLSDASNKSLTIDANKASLVMDIYAGSDVALAGLTITGGNNTTYDGGGIENYGGTLTVTNSTISSNTADVCGGIYNDGTLTVNNSIVAKNSTDIYRSGGTVIGSNNLIGDGTNSGFSNSLNGNIVGTSANPIDPLFVNFAGGDYRLTANSPAVNKGSNALAAEAGLTAASKDRAGNARIVGGIIDIGAYECDASAVTPPVKPTLSTPTGLKVAANSLGMSSFTLNWNAVTTGATKYDIYLVGKAEPLVTDVTGTFKSIAELQPGVKYQFQVVARNDNGEISASSTALTVTTLKAPPAPTAFAVQAKSVSTQSSITLSWVAPTKSMPADAVLAGYEISYSYTDPVTKKVETVIANPNIASGAVFATINNLPYAGLNYTFTIKAKYTIGSSEIYSAVVTKAAKTAAWVAPAFTVSTKDLDYGQLRVILTSISMSPGTVVYEIYAGSRQVIDASIDDNVISGLSTGTKYTIFAYYLNDDGTKSAVKSLTATTKALPAPTALKAKATGINSITVTWTAPKAVDVDKVSSVATPDGYQVRYSYTDPTSKQVIWSNWTSASSGDEFTGLPFANVKYTFYVSAKYTIGSDTIRSNELLATAAISPTAFVAPKLGIAKVGATAAVPAVTAIGLGTATVNWTKSTGVSGEKTEGYIVRVLLGGNVVFEKGNVAESAVSQVITGLAPNTKYTVQVIAKSGTLESLAAQTTVTTKAMPIVKPAKSADVKNQTPYTTYNSTRLEWSVPVISNGEKVEYQVFFAIANTPAAFVLCATATDAGFSANGKQLFTITGLTANTQYYFKVVAKYSTGLTVFGETIAAAVGVKTLKA